MAKKVFTTRLDEELLERCRNAIWALGNRTTLTAILSDALLAWVEAQEKRHNKGKHFDRREGELPFTPKKK